MKAFTKSTERFEIPPSLLRDVRQKRPEGRVKKKSEQKKTTKKSFFQRFPSFFQICVVCITVYARDRATKKDSKTSRDRARKEATTSGDIFVVEEERREFKRVLRCFSA